MRKGVKVDWIAFYSTLPTTIGIAKVDLVY